MLKGTRKVIGESSLSREEGAIFLSEAERTSEEVSKVSLL